MVRYIGVHALGDLSARFGGGRRRRVLLRVPRELDLVGHLYGPGSAAWRMQLRQVDWLVESIVEGLPSGGLLAVVADHGMVSVDDAEAVDIDATRRCTTGVDAIGGEVRARHLYTRGGAVEDVLAAWRTMLGDRAWVATRDEAIAAGWFGDRVATRRARASAMWSRPLGVRRGC